MLAREGPDNSRDEDADDEVAVCVLAVYAVYDEGFEKDGAVL